MNQILSLREKRAKAWDAAKAFLDSKRGPDGMLSAEDAATYDKMEADVVALGKEVERLERQAALDRELNQPVDKPITVAVMGCVVNCPGEASAADCGIAGGVGEGLLFKKGQIIKKVPQDQLVDELFRLIDTL